MTPFDLIDSIFGRVQRDQAANTRVITPDQLKYLRNLIAADPDGGRVRREGPFTTVWAPPGNWKYSLFEDPIGRRHTLTRHGNIMASDSGFLF